MPIRFRCEYCGQLLAIARRKAGATIACPKCDHVNLVPETPRVEEALPEGVNAALESLRVEDWLGKAKPRPAEAASVLMSSDPNVEISVAPEREQEFVFLENETPPSQPHRARAAGPFLPLRKWWIPASLVLSGFAAGVVAGKLLF